MNNRLFPYASCDACGKSLYAGQTTVTLNRNVEKLRFTDTCPDGEITVSNSSELISLCAECGEEFTSERIADALKAALKLSARMFN